MNAVLAHTGWMLLLLLGLGPTLEAQQTPEAKGPKPGPKFPIKTVAELKQILNGRETETFTHAAMQIYPKNQNWLATAKVTGHNGNILESERRFTAQEKRIDGQYLVTTLRRPDLKKPIHSVVTYHPSTHCYARWVFTDGSTKPIASIGLAVPGGRTVAWTRFNAKDTLDLSLSRQGEKILWTQVLFEKNRFRYRLDGWAKPTAPDTPLAASGLRAKETGRGPALPTMTVKQAREIVSAPNREKMEVPELKFFPMFGTWEANMHVIDTEGEKKNLDPPGLREKKVDGKYRVTRLRLPPEVPVSVSYFTTYHKPTGCYVRWNLTDPEGTLVRTVGRRLPNTPHIAWTSTHRDNTGVLTQSLFVESITSKHIAWAGVTFKNGRFQMLMTGSGKPPAF